MMFSVFSSSNVTARPEHIAILTSNITTDVDDNPLLTFYAQLSTDTVVSSAVLMMAVEVRVHSDQGLNGEKLESFSTFEVGRVGGL